MADVQEDTISIVITADAAGATDAFDQALGKLDELEAKVAGMSGRLGGFGSGLAQGIAPALDALSNLADRAESLDGFEKRLTGVADGIGRLSEVTGTESASAGRTVSQLASSIGSLESLDGNRLDALANGLDKIPDAVRELSGTSLDTIDGLRDKLDALADASAKASKVGNGIAGLGQGLRNIPRGIEGMNSIKDYGSEMVSLQGRLSALSRAVTVFSDESKSSVRSIRSLAEALGMLSKTDASALASGLSAAETALKSFVSDLNGWAAENDISDFLQLADAVDKVASAYSKLDAAKAAVGKGGGVTGGLMGGLSSGKAQGALLDIAGRTSSVMSGIGNVAGNALSAGWNTATRAAQAYLSVMTRIASVPLDGMRASIDGVAHSLSRIASMAASAVFYNTLFSVLRSAIDGVTTGIQNLYQWALIMGDGFVGTMDSCAASMLYFQNSIGAAASSLLDALAPALETIINYAVAALNAINQLLAALTGRSTWRRARRAQTSFASAATGAGKASKGAAKSAEDNADATDDATDAAKKYENTVMGFDELNKLNAEPDDSSKKGRGKKGRTPSGGGGGGGGGGAGAPDYGSMFEDVPVDDYFKDLANTDDWTKLGEDIANALNDWEKNIDWAAIDKTAAKWSKRIWTAFNGFVHARDWSSFGYTIARGLNVGLHFIDDIAQHADFTYLGAGLAGALNRAVAVIDWPALGRVMTDGLKVSLEMLHGFMNGNEVYKGFNFDALRLRLNSAIDAAFGNIDWHTAITDVTNGLAQVARTIVSGMNQVLVNVDWVVQTYDWAGWGASIADHLRAAISTVDWGNLGRILTDGLKIALEGLHGFLEESEANGTWQAIGDGIQTGITAAFNNIDWAQAGWDLNRLANHILDVVEQALGAVNWDDVNTFLANLNIPQILERALGDIAKACVDLFVNGLDTFGRALVVAWVVGKVAPVALSIAKFFIQLKSDQQILEAAKSLGDSAGGGIADGTVEGLGKTSLGEKISEWISGNIGSAGTTTAAGSLGSSIGTAIVGAIGVAMTFDGVQRQLDDGISALGGAETIGGAALTGGSIGFAFGGPMGAAIGAAIGAAGGALTEFSLFVYQKRDEISDKLSTAFDGFKDSASQIPDKVGGAFDTVGQKISDFVSGIGDKFSGVPDTIGNAFTSVPQKVSDALGGLLDKVKQAFSPTVAYGEEAGDETGTNYAAAVGDHQDDAAGSGASLGDAVRDAISPFVKDAEGWGDTLGSNLRDGIDGMRSRIQSTSQQTGQDIHDKLDPFVRAALQWGESTGRNLSSGIDNLRSRVQTSASNAGNDVKTKITDVTSKAGDWGSKTSRDLAGGISSLLNTVSSAATGVANAVSTAIGYAVSGAWGQGSNTSQNFGNGISWNSGTVRSAASSVASNAASAFGGYASSAYNWGRDLVSNFANGIRSLYNTVANAASDVARAVADRLHFSEPDVGPLSDFHTYAPDMMRQLAQGIDRYRYLVTDSVNRVAGTMESGLKPDLGDVRVETQATIANAVTLGVVGSQPVQQQPQASDRPITLVLRIGNEDIARATYRGIESLASRGVVVPEFV